MNDQTLISKPPYNLKRIFSKICMVVSTFPLLPPYFRFKFLQWGGVRFRGRCYIGGNVEFDGIYPNLIQIGQGCIITTGTHILSHFFNTSDRRFYAGKIKIGNRVFIGMNTLIVNSVTIGDDSVIAAGSVITKDIPAKEVWGGNPAKFIKKLS
ncbi:MAG: acyltransferase [Muribaculaceae bacterium]|nr:acyltransferase [Muribaculaceae bacterium]